MAFLYVGNDGYVPITEQIVDALGLTHFVLANGIADTWGTGNSEHRFPDYIQIQVEAFNHVIHSTNGEQKRVYFGPPCPYGYSKLQEWGGCNTTAGCKYFQIYDEILARYVEDIRNAIGAENWNKYVAGIYIGMENVLDSYVNSTLKMDYTSTETILKHPHVALYNKISKLVHSSYSHNGQTWNPVKLLWSPYYPHNPEYDAATNSNAKTEHAQVLIKNLAAVINKTDIFDEVIMQPNYYFNIDKNPDWTSNGLKAVKYSTGKSAMTWMDGVIVFPKTSKTRIGVQMEIDSDYYIESAPLHSLKKIAYDKYVSTFNNADTFIEGYDKNNYIFSYYFGGNKHSHNENIYREIRNFYNTIPF